MNTISVIARIFLVIFVFIYGVVNVGGQMAMANAAVISKFLGQDGFVYPLTLFILNTSLLIL